MFSLLKPSKPDSSPNGAMPKEIVYNPNGEPDDVPRLEIFNEIVETLNQFGFSDELRFHNYRYFLYRIACCYKQIFFAQKHVGLIVGPTGCGKTTSVEAFCEQFSIPHYVENVTNCVTEGIKGTSVAKIVSDYFFQVKNSGEEWHIPRAVLLDDIHALVCKGSNYGPQVLHQLLPLFAGEPMYASRSYKNGDEQKPPEKIPTDKLIVILLASFDGSLTRNDASGNGEELQNKTIKEILRAIEALGFPGELLGRLTLPPVILPGPTKSDLERCLQRNDERNPIPELLGTVTPGKLTITDQSVDFILKETIKRNLGYRGLRQLCEEFVCHQMVKILNGATHI